MKKVNVIAKAVRTEITDIFDEVVPVGKVRYILAIAIVGDGVASRVVDIYKKTSNNEYKPILPMIPIAPADMKMIPPNGPDVDKPIVVLESSMNLAGKVNAGAGVSLAIWYYDYGT